MADPNRQQEQDLCVAHFKQYTCGCKGSIYENRRRDCLQCRTISRLAGKAAFCLPSPVEVTMSSKCHKCEHYSGSHHTGPDNSNAAQPQEANSGTVEPRQIRCAAMIKHFVCECSGRIHCKRTPNCLACADILRAAGQPGQCRPLFVPVRTHRICDKCMLSIEERVQQPPRRLGTDDSDDEDVAGASQR
jgi:ribosomal protein L32